MRLLGHILDNTTPTVTDGVLDDGTVWQYLDEGVLILTPKIYTRQVLFSAGIHGNETAPMELLDKLCDEIFAGVCRLGVRLMVIFGNPNAIRAGVRYVDNDINRLFLGKYQNIDNPEAMRVALLERLVADFFAKKTLPSLHYDLHTAIKPTLKTRFALLPKSDVAFDDDFLASLHVAGMDAIVYHQEKSTTFSQFSTACGAMSVTLELGKAMPFGCNDLSQFLSSYEMLSHVAQDKALPSTHHQAQSFVIDQIIIKQSEAFVLCVDKDMPNFSLIPAKQVIAYDELVIDHQKTRLTYQYDTPYYSLFLNANVKVGLRAGMLLRAIS